MASRDRLSPDDLLRNAGCLGQRLASYIVLFSLCMPHSPLRSEVCLTHATSLDTLCRRLQNLGAAILPTGVGRGCGVRMRMHMRAWVHFAEKAGAHARTARASAKSGGKMASCLETFYRHFSKLSAVQGDACTRACYLLFFQKAVRLRRLVNMLSRALVFCILCFLSKEIIYVLFRLRRWGC